MDIYYTKNGQHVGKIPCLLIVGINKMRFKSSQMFTTQKYGLLQFALAAITEYHGLGKRYISHIFRVEQVQLKQIWTTHEDPLPGL